MTSEHLTGMTVATLEGTRRRWTVVRPVLEMPLVPVSQEAVLATFLFVLWVRPPAEYARCGDGWRYLHITWQRPADDQPIWQYAVGPMSWQTEGKIEVRWGNARWSTATMNGVFAAA